MKEGDYWELHDTYADLLDHFGIDIEGSEYKDHGTYPTYVHKTKSDHKEAIRLISILLEKESELPVERLETWEEDYETSEWAGRYGRVTDGGKKEDNPVNK